MLTTDEASGQIGLEEAFQKKDVANVKARAEELIQIQNPQVYLNRIVATPLQMLKTAIDEDNVELLEALLPETFCKEQLNKLGVLNIFLLKEDLVMGQANITALEYAIRNHKTKAAKYLIQNYVSLQNANSCQQYAGLATDFNNLEIILAILELLKNQQVIHKENNQVQTSILINKRWIFFYALSKIKGQNNKLGLLKYFKDTNQLKEMYFEPSAEGNSQRMQCVTESGQYTPAHIAALEERMFVLQWLVLHAPLFFDYKGMNNQHKSAWDLLKEKQFKVILFPPALSEGKPNLISIDDFLELKDKPLKFAFVNNKEETFYHELLKEKEDGLLSNELDVLITSLNFTTHLCPQLLNQNNFSQNHPQFQQNNFLVFESMLKQVMVQDPNPLLPEDALTLMKVSKALKNLITNHQLYWKKKYQLHFSVQFKKQEAARILIDNWYQEFWKTYNETYQSLPKPINPLIFSTSIEGQIESYLKKFKPADFVSEIRNATSYFFKVSTPLGYFFDQKKLSSEKGLQLDTEAQQVLNGYYKHCHESLAKDKKLPQQLVESNLNPLEKIETLLMHLKLCLSLRQEKAFFEQLKLTVKVLATINTQELLQTALNKLGKLLGYMKEDVELIYSKTNILHNLILIEMLKAALVYALQVVDKDFFKSILSGLLSINSQELVCTEEQDGLNKKIYDTMIIDNSYLSAVFNALLVHLYIYAICTERLEMVDLIGDFEVIKDNTIILKLNLYKKLERSIWFNSLARFNFTDYFNNYELYMPVDFAALTGNFEIFKKVVAQIPINQKQLKYLSDLKVLNFAACYIKNYDITKQILFSLIEIEDIPKKLQALKIIFSHEVSKDLICILTSHLIKTQTKEEYISFIALSAGYGKNLLRTAIESSDSNLLEALLPKEFCQGHAPITLSYNKEYTALQEAIRLKSDAVALYLIQQGIDINTYKAETLPPYQLAVQAKPLCIEVLASLVQQITQSKLSLSENESPFFYIFLHLSMIDEKSKFLQLIQKFSSLSDWIVPESIIENFTEKFKITIVPGDTVAHLAARKNDLALLQWLYKNNPELFAMKNNAGETVWNLLDKLKYKYFIPTNLGRLSAHLPENFRKEKSIVNKLIFVDEHGNTAIQQAISNPLNESEIELIRDFFIKDLALDAAEYKQILQFPNAQHNKNVLQTACESEHSEAIIKKLIPESFLKDTSFTITVNSKKELFLNYALKKYVSPKIIKYLAQQTAELKETDANNKSPLFCAIENTNSLATVKCLIDEYNSLNLMPPGQSPLLAVFLYGHMNIITRVGYLEELNKLKHLDWSASLDKPRDFSSIYEAISGDNIAHLAARSGDIESLKWLLKNNHYDLFNQKNSKKQTVWDLCKQKNIKLESLSYTYTLTLGSTPVQSILPNSDIRKNIKAILSNNAYWKRQVTFSLWDDQPASIKAMKKLVAGNENFDFAELAKQIKPTGLKSYFFRKKETQQFYDLIQTIANCYKENNTELCLGLLKSYINLMESQTEPASNSQTGLNKK